MSDTLNLGWYWSENKEELQMAKIVEEDRATHFYVIGATGTGKTKFLEFLIQQDINKRNGFGVIDPHGDLIEDIKSFLALDHDPTDKEITERVILIDPSDSKYTVTFNPLEKIPNVSASEQANELVSSFKKIWSDSWGVRMEDLMRNSLISLGEAGCILTDLPLFLTDRAVRRSVLDKVNHSVAKNYFKRFDSLTDRSQVSWVEPVMNKINAYFSDERIRQIFSSQKSSFNLRKIIDEKKILLIKLDKGKLKDSADLLGSLLMAKIQIAAFSRTDIPQSKRSPFYLYIDEFQNFANESFSVVLSEARKYGLSLIMSHQSLSQIPSELRSLILGNTGIQVYFRLNRQDSQVLAKEAFQYSGYEVKYISSFRPKFWTLGEEWEHYVEELQDFPNRTCYVKHKIEGGIIPIYTEGVEPAWEVLGMEEDEYHKYLKKVPFGRNYLISKEDALSSEEIRQKSFRDEVGVRKDRQRGEQIASKTRKETLKQEEEVVTTERKKKKVASKDEKELSAEEKGFLRFVSKNPGMFVTKIYKALKLSGYKGDKLKESLIDKELVFQEETRRGRKGRLAKVLSLTKKGTTVLKKLSPGKGGDLHKHFQEMIKEQAKLFGWKAKIEERISRSLETVDVGLRKEDVRVAVEISATSTAEQEVQNIRKCLDAGYDYIVSVCDDEKSLQSIKREVRKSFISREKERIKVFTPEQVKEYLSSLNSIGIVSEKGIVSGQIKKEKELLDTKEAAEFLGIKKSTLYEWIIQRKIPHIKVGRLVKFRRKDLEEWLKKRTKEEENFV